VVQALNDAFDYCLTSLRTVDRDRYLACLLMPSDIQRDMAALYLFDAETARIRDLVKEPMAGEIRLQWWRDLISGDSDGSESGPLAHALKDTITRHNLPPKPFIDLLDARIFDLYDDPMPTVESFELYAGETASSIIQMSLIIAAPGAATRGADAAGHAGVALATARVLKALVKESRRGQVYIPASMLEAVGSSPTEFINPESDPEKRSAAISVFAGYGQEHLKKARAAFHAADLPIWPFLHIGLLPATLSAASKLGAGIFDKPFGPGPFRRQWTLWRVARKGRF
jgi:phytoene synthase